ncbi:MAG: polysaccharide deacetylase family protein [Tepidisphaeraceae bacterium]|jgi:peptidoglycan/xylan/chitin deacetylase (PgdA/CDA1 family)
MLIESCEEWTARLAKRLGDGEICLTFDDGPGDPEPNGKTLAIAEFLAREGIKATFFAVGRRIERPGGRDALGKLSQLGHLIGNHTFTHPDLTELVKDGQEGVVQEVVRTHKLIRDFVADGPLVFRPPSGAWNQATCRAVNSAKEMEQYFGPITCDVLCFDWDLGKQRDGTVWNISHCQGYLISQLRTLGKGVVLLHDSTSEEIHTDVHIRREQQVYELTKWLVGWLRGENFKFVGLDELLRAV